MLLWSIGKKILKSDTMIVYLDGKYHLYKMDYEDFETKLIGVYDTVEEVNDSIENNCK